MVCLWVAPETGHAMGFSDFVTEFPKRSFVLTPPANDPTQWKEIGRLVTQKEALVELIPCDQSEQNFSELIGIQYYDISDRKIPSARNFMNTLRQEFLSAHPDFKLSWNIIEQNKDDIIYEWALVTPLNELEQEISRLCIKDKEFHRIGFTKKHKEFLPEERQHWIKLLRESTTLLDFKAAAQLPQKLSLVDHFKTSVKLGDSFRDWRVITDWTEASGYAMVEYAPPSESILNITECLAVFTFPTLHSVSGERLLQMEKDRLLKQMPIGTAFKVLKTAPNEVIVTFSHLAKITFTYERPDEFVIINTINRAISTDQGYVLINYKRSLPRALEDKELLERQERLETIKIIDFRKPSTDNLTAP